MTHEQPTPTVLADVARLPVRDGVADLAVACLSFQDVDDLPARSATGPVALRPGGRLWVAIVHPINSAGAFADNFADAPFVIRGSYLDEFRYSDRIERDGLAMTFHSAHRPLETYVHAFEDADLVLEALRVPAFDGPPEVSKFHGWRRLHVLLPPAASPGPPSRGPACLIEQVFAIPWGWCSWPCPPRDPDARARLAEAGGRARPVVLAHERALAVPGSLHELVPEGLVRGAVAVVDGEPGSGATSVALTLCAAATGVGSGPRPSISRARSAGRPPPRRGSPSIGSSWPGGSPPPAGPRRSTSCSTG